MDPTDGGTSSRKLGMAYVVMGLITLGFVGTAIWPALEAAYATYIMGLLGAAGIYAGSNAAVKYIHSKTQQQKIALEAEEEEEGVVYESEDE
jgi:hypothetical protein